MARRITGKLFNLDFNIDVKYVVNEESVLKLRTCDHAIESPIHFPNMSKITVEHTGTVVKELTGRTMHETCEALLYSPFCWDPEV